MSQKKPIIEQMYDAVMENGGPTGPFSKAIVEAFEGTRFYKEREKKVIISFLKKNNQNS